MGWLRFPREGRLAASRSQAPLHVSRCRSYSPKGGGRATTENDTQGYRCYYGVHSKICTAEDVLAELENGPAHDGQLECAGAARMLCARTSAHGTASDNLLRVCGERGPGISPQYIVTRTMRQMLSCNLRSASARASEHGYEEIACSVISVVPITGLSCSEKYSYAHIAARGTVRPWGGGGTTSILW